MTRRLSQIFLGAAFAALVTSTPHAMQGDESLSDAARRGDVVAIRALLKNGAEVNAAGGDGMSPLHFAALNNQVEAAKLLAYAGANLGATTRLGGYTPL